MSKLANVNEKFKKVIVTYDITKKEWEKCKELVAKAKQDEETMSRGNSFTGFEDAPRISE